MGSPEIRMGGYGLCFLVQEVTQPHGRLLHSHPHSIVKVASIIPHPKTSASSEETKNRDLERTQILKDQKRPDLALDSEIQWGIHWHEPWGEFWSISYPEINKITQFLQPRKPVTNLSYLVSRMVRNQVENDYAEVGAA